MASNEPLYFRHLIRDRLLVEMLRGTSGSGSVTEWKVLIMDEYTLKVISSTCKMADITEEGVSLVEDLKKRRQPMPALDAVYFIQPTKENVNRLIEDMGGSRSLYRAAHIFFSSSLDRESLNPIKENALMRTRIAALKEINLEILTIDRQGFLTDQENALVDLFGRDTSHYERCIDTMADRLATVFASLKDFPLVRYRAAKTSSSEAGTPVRARDLVPTKLAASLWDRLLVYKQKLSGFPHTDTCDLLIIDRTTDPVAPIIHDWSYGGMAFDLLDMEGNKYKLKLNTESGKVEERVVLLEEQDSIWTELRDLFIKEALDKVTKLSDEIVAKQRTSQKSEMSAKEMQAVIASLGKYREQKDKVDLHVNIAESLMSKVKAESLVSIGSLEQGFVFGDTKATFKELFNALGSTSMKLSSETKIRLLAVYAATHPDRFTPDKRSVYMERAELTEEEMLPIHNLDILGLTTAKLTHSKTTTLTFGKKSSKNITREERGARGGEWELMRFYPLIHDLMEDLHLGELDKETYAYVQEPKTSASNSLSSSGSNTGSVRTRAAGGSVRNVGSVSSTGSWASRRTSSSSSDREAPDAFLKARKLVIFVIGGISRSELRAVHLLTKELQREVIIGSTSLETPQSFINKLAKLS